jgi:hypothetical protein
MKKGSRANSFLNGEWKFHVRKWGKKFTSGVRRAVSKEIVRNELKEKDDRH